MTHPRILVLEDDPRLRSQLCTVLREEGLAVTGASRAQEALASAEQRPFELMIADIRLDGMDGLEALARVRRVQPAIRTIVITGFSSEADSVRSWRLGVNDYLPKPFEIQELIAAVERQLQSHRENARLQKLDESSRSLVVWCLEKLLKLCPPATRGPISQAHLLARRLGLTPRQAQEAVILALVEYLRTRGQHLDLTLVQECLWPALPGWLHLSEPELEESPVRRLARATLSGLLGQEVQLPPDFQPLRLHSLGTIKVSIGTEALEDTVWSNRKHLLLLLYLASFPGPQHEDQLIDRLWPDKDAVSGRNNINTALSSIRKLLKAHGADASLLKRDKRGIWLERSRWLWFDLDEFYRSLKAAREGPPANRQAHLRQACEICRGPFLGGQAFEWAESIRESQFHAWVQALLQLSQVCFAEGRPEEALEHSQRLLELDPCCQRGCLIGMQSCLSLERAEDAIRLFERLKRNLQQDLGIEPMTELLEMRQRALISLTRGEIV